MAYGSRRTELGGSLHQSQPDPRMAAWVLFETPKLPMMLWTCFLIVTSARLTVGNQHKWDRLGPEKIIIMKSCVGAP